MSELARKLEEVKDETTFVAFVQALEHDRRNGASEWVPEKIEDFLEAAARWAVDSKDNPKFHQANPWKRAAEIIYCGKIYE